MTTLIDIHVDAQVGDDFEGDGSRTKPFQSMSKVFNKINLMDNDSYEFKITMTGSFGPYGRNEALELVKEYIG